MSLMHGLVSEIQNFPPEACYVVLHPGKSRRRQEMKVSGHCTDNAYRMETWDIRERDIDLLLIDEFRGSLLSTT